MNLALGGGGDFKKYGSPPHAQRSVIPAVCGGADVGEETLQFCFPGGIAAKERSFIHPDQMAVQLLGFSIIKGDDAVLSRKVEPHCCGRRGKQNGDGDHGCAGSP